MNKATHLYKKPRAKSLPSKTPLDLDQPRKAALTGVVAERRYLRISMELLQQAAKWLRASKSPEAIELADALTSRIGAAQRGGRPRGTFRVQFRVQWEGGEPVIMSRNEAAEMLGITAATLSVMVSRNGGVWNTLRKDGDNRLLNVSISRCNPTESKPAECPE